MDSPCKGCIHEHVCAYRKDFEALTNKVAEMYNKPVAPPLSIVAKCNLCSKIPETPEAVMSFLEKLAKKR